MINPHCIFPEVTQYKNTPYSIKDDNKAKKSSNSGTSECLVFLAHVVSGTSEMMKCGPESSGAEGFYFDDHKVNNYSAHVTK